MAIQTFDASYARPEYMVAFPKWQRIIAACDGEDAVKTLTPSVLPYLNPSDKSDRNKDRNSCYLQRAVYFNATGRTLEGLIGLAFAKDPDVNLGTFTYLADNANGEGVSIYHCAQQALSGVLQTGRYGILTDLTNDKPSISGYDAQSIINWRVEVRDGVRKLVMLVLKETVADESGEYNVDFIDQYREYRLVNGRVQLKIWKQNGPQTPLAPVAVALQRPDHNQPFFDEIPFSFIGSKSNSSDVQPAPLLGLAEMNLAHFRDSADYQDSVFFSGQVQSWISGLSEDWRDWLEEKGLYIGSRTPILLPTGASFGFAQAQPNQLVREAMEDKRQAMIALGARVVEENKVSKTATQAAGDIATGTSVLGLCCGNVNEAMTRALQFCGLFDNSKKFDGAKFIIPTDFSVSKLSPQDIQALIGGWQAGAYSRKDLRAILKKGGVIAPERTDGQIDEELAGEMNNPVFNPPVETGSGGTGDSA